MKGPFGDEMAKEFSDLAKSMNKEDGFIWDGESGEKCWRNLLIRNKRSS
ncbi:hypothetical protein B4134_1891 [Bacillus safensis]|nr:hypothetical protein B4134_1891 [Bacillus safensis]